MNALESLESRYDVVVVGARCAGAATAMLLGRAGLSVLAIDRAREGSDTLSTHAFMRGGLLQLHRWGLLDRVVASGAPAIRSTTFHYGDERVEVAIQPRDGVEALYAPRRSILDALLAGAAREAGVRVAFEVRARELVRDRSGRVRGILVEGNDGSRARIETSLVIGADGIRSQVAEWVGAPVALRGSHATGVLFGYWEGLDREGYHWHYRPGRSVGTIPTHHGLTCVFVALPPERLSDELRGGREVAYRRLLTEAAPEMERLAGRVRLVGPIRSFPGVPGYLRRAHGPGWALVGDAGFFRDPLTAHGMTDALHHAELLARAAVRDDAEGYAEYERDRDALAVDMLLLSDRVASFDWDLPRVQELHRELSRNMGLEVERIRSWGDVPPAVSSSGWPERRFRRPRVARPSAAAAAFQPTSPS